MGQESRSVLVEQYGSRVPLEVNTKYWLGLQSSEGLTEAGRYDSTEASSYAWQVSAGCRQEASVSHHTDLSMGLCECLLNIVVSYPQSE